MAAVLDAAERSIGRRDLSFFGRESHGSEDRLVPQWDRDKVIFRCHDLRRNNPIVSGATGRIVENVVGPRVRLQARTSSAEWNDRAEHWMNNWSACIDPGERLSLTDGAKLTVAAGLYDGEIMHHPTPEGQIAIIESTRIRDSKENKKPYILDKNGKILKWNVQNRNDKGGFDQKEDNWVSGIIHCARRWRPDQIRGWPELAVVANIVTDLNEINSAQLRKNKISALAAWVYERGQSGGSLTGRTVTPSGGQSLHKFQEGQIYEIEKGSKLGQFVNNQPGAEYTPFVELNLRLVGMALGIPYEFLLMYFGGGSFSSSKASLLQAYKTIEGWQEWVEFSYIIPVTQYRINKAIKDRELPPAPVDKYGVSEWKKWEWQRPSVDWIDPQNAIQTEMQEVRMGATTMYEVCSKRGHCAEEVARSNARYLKMIDRIASEEGVSANRLHDIQIPGQTPLAPEENPKEDADKKDKK